MFRLTGPAAGCTSWIGYGLVALATVPAFAVDPGDDVVLRLVDGRVVRGRLASAADDERVVITAEAPGGTVSSSFPAARVVAVLDAADFDRARRTIVVDGADESVLPPPTPDGTPIAVSREPVGRPRPDRPALVRSLVVEARLSNWDADVETDGLLLRVVPLDEFGDVVPVRGTINAELFLQQFRTNRRIPWRRRERSFFESDRWNQRLTPEDFGPDGAYVELPFRRLQPDIDLDVAPNALVHARLVVPGRGSFEASDANVRVRELSRFRDELEQLTGRRFLPNENVRRWPSSPSSRLRSDR